MREVWIPTYPDAPLTPIYAAVTAEGGTAFATETHEALQFANRKECLAWCERAQVEGPVYALAWTPKLYRLEYDA
jgi:hypothetical protein